MEVVRDCTSQIKIGLLHDVSFPIHGLLCLLPINVILTNPQNCDSESPSSSVDQKKLQAKPLKSAVDDWVGRLLALVSSDMVQTLS
ncbi:hypothetical protein YC2023_099824 [Brassica napus]